MVLVKDNALFIHFIFDWLRPRILHLHANAATAATAANGLMTCVLWIYFQLTKSKRTQTNTNRHALAACEPITAANVLRFGSITEKFIFQKHISCFITSLKIILDAPKCETAYQHFGIHQLFQFDV